MKTLFVTSFDPTLFEASGKRLLESFVFYQQSTHREDFLLCCTEGSDARTNKFFDSLPGVRTFELEHDQFLQDWLKINADIIPNYLGGTAVQCDCPDTKERHAKHKHGCHWQWMNRNASRWFRKVASLRAMHQFIYAKVSEPAFDFLVWLDADAYFKAPLPHEYLAKKLARKTAMFYFRGHRPAVESGILGFNIVGKCGAARFIVELCQRYTSGKFRQDERWDDGFQIAKVIDDLPALRARAEPHTVIPRVLDLVHPTKYKTGPHRTNDVIPTTDIVAYLVHEKGRHGTGLDIMK